MIISRVRLINTNGFSDTGFINMSENINIFTGQNNAGKSTVIHSILRLQYPNGANISTKKGSINPSLTYIIQKGHRKFQVLPTNQHLPRDCDTYRLLGETIQMNDWINFTKDSNSAWREIGFFPTKEPDNLIYPYLSKRKVTNYTQTINSESTNSVHVNLANLYPKIDRMCNAYEDGHDIYFEITKEIFGYPISTVKTSDGTMPAYRISKNNYVPITAMGEGVTNLLGIIVDLCVAKNKIFLIEELENDIHPKALKVILNLIKTKSEDNQFFISTHSNVVLKELGVDKRTKIFQITMSIDEGTKIPKSEIRAVGKSKSERVRVLEDLGYEFQDFELWQAWLFLEESSAEQLIREYFIKWFNPNLTGKLKTFSARSKDEVIPKFKNFNDLFVFLHLEPTYKDKAWVIIDAGDDEEKIIDSMKKMYVEKNGWTDSRFRQLLKHNFEEYYPVEFKPKDDIQNILNIPDKQERREAKKNLLGDLLTWISENEDVARTAFENSAKEVIDILNEIEEELGA